MKNIKKNDIVDSVVHYIEFQLPSIGEYWNASRFVELFDLEAQLMCVDRHPSTGEQLYAVRMSYEAFQESKMSYDEIKEVIANTFNICCDEHNKEQMEKDLVRKNELDNFNKNGVQNQNLLDNDYSKNYPLEELQEYAKDLLNDAIESDDTDLKHLWYSDSQDVLKALYHLDKGEIDEATRNMFYLDTAVREGVPDSVWSLLRD